MKTTMERRQFRRAEVDVPVAIRPLEQDGSPQTGAVITCQVKNISLGGVFCYTQDPCPLKVGEQVACSITIPPEQARLFPFTRVLGKGRVVRLEPIPVGRRAGETPAEEPLLGVAVAFALDVTALGTIA